VERLSPSAAVLRLLDLNDGSKVDKSHAATRAFCSRRPPLLEVSVTSRLRELIQQLGEDGEKSGPFTSNDLHFLRSLRISVEGEEEGAEENDTE
jgi:hypothetical protein